MTALRLIFEEFLEGAEDFVMEGSDTDCCYLGKGWAS